MRQVPRLCQPWLRMSACSQSSTADAAVAPGAIVTWPLVGMRPSGLRSEVWLIFRTPLADCNPGNALNVQKRPTLTPPTVWLSLTSPLPA
jgi:hypothetical protein